MQAQLLVVGFSFLNGKLFLDNKTCCRIKNINIIRVEPRTTYTNDKIVMVQCNGPDPLVKTTSVPCAVFVLQLSALCRLQLRADVM